MKKWLFILLLFGAFLLAWCTNNISKNKTQEWLSPYWTWMSVDEVHCKSHWWYVVRQEFPDWNYMSHCFFADWTFCSTIDFYEWKCENPTETWFTLEDAIFNYIEDNYSCDDWSKLFVNYAELWQDNTDFYINAIGEWFYIDERWNLNNSCGFSIPMRITVYTEDWSNYVVRDAVQARDWDEYDKSIREMFSEEAIDRLYNWNYDFIDGRTLLEIAEEYFWVTIIPETENDFECKFCDKLRFYEQNPEADEKLKESNDLHFNYISEDNWKNTIYFGSGWAFEAEWNRNKWTWTWAFGQDENTVIVLNNNIDHVYDRYIITNQTENSLSTILEIIQRR